MTERGVPPSATAAAVPAPAQAAPQAELLVPRPAPRRGLAEEEREGKKRRLRPREEPEHQ
ncbi:hypothetical protein SAY87_017777 [Trapa incisa]|uniref:Uncharacterized protein n=1 Tax=Trapa incisa TaxID=236973 RepID=A0AAN7QVN7_9MYRT|nr:hypothetical protein SAY87_017777 [Trapa incisa]